MPTLPQLTSALDALAYRVRSLSGEERGRLGRREMDEIDALVQLGRDDIHQFPSGPSRPDDLARLDRFVARVSAQFERLLSEPTRVVGPPPISAGPARYRRDPDDWRQADEPPSRAIGVATGQE